MATDDDDADAAAADDDVDDDDDYDGERSCCRVSLTTPNCVRRGARAAAWHITHHPCGMAHPLPSPCPRAQRWPGALRALPGAAPPRDVRRERLGRGDDWVSSRGLRAPFGLRTTLMAHPLTLPPRSCGGEGHSGQPHVSTCAVGADCSPAISGATTRSACLQVPPPCPEPPDPGG